MREASNLKTLRLRSVTVSHGQRKQQSQKRSEEAQEGETEAGADPQELLIRGVAEIQRAGGPLVIAVEKHHDNVSVNLPHDPARHALPYVE